MDKNTIVIGIDHGWANMKTVNHLFTSGVKEITTELALYEDVLEWEGKFYKIGGKRLDVKRDKVQDDNYYLLTLAALAKELEKRHQRNARVLLAAGLPLTRFGEEKDSFIRYLLRDREITFRYNKIKYHVVLERVSVYPQCYAAVADRMQKFDNKVLVVDIGSWTVDIMPIINHTPDESVCVTKPSGFITCIQQINKECVRQIGAEVDEYDIQKLLTSRGTDLPDEYRKIIEKEIQAYCQQVYHYIRELGYNMDLTPVIFVGGGAGSNPLSQNKLIIRCIEEHYAMLAGRKSDKTLEERVKSYVDGEVQKIKQEIGKEIYQDVFLMFTSGLAAAGNQWKPAAPEITAEKPEEPTRHTDTGEIDLSENADMMDDIMKWS